MYSTLTNICKISIILLILSGCSVRNDYYRKDESQRNIPKQWSAENLTDGPASMLIGVTSPITCGIYTTGEVLKNDRGLGYLFSPLIVSFGALAGTVRGVSMITTGSIDTLTGSAFLLSYPYLDFSTGFSQWCYCMYAPVCKDSFMLRQEAEEMKKLEQQEQSRIK